MKRVKLSKCLFSLTGKHEWRDWNQERARGIGEKWFKKHGWRQCANCGAWIDYKKYLKRKKKQAARDNG